VARRTPDISLGQGFDRANSHGTAAGIAGLGCDIRRLGNNEKWLAKNAPDPRRAPYTAPIMEPQLFDYLLAEHRCLSLAHDSLVREFRSREGREMNADVLNRLRDHRQLLANHHLAVQWMRTVLKKPPVSPGLVVEGCASDVLRAS
jgi:hypothetical protein